MEDRTGIWRLFSLADPIDCPVGVTWRISRVATMREGIDQQAQHWIVKHSRRWFWKNPRPSHVHSGHKADASNTNDSMYRILTAPTDPLDWRSSYPWVFDISRSNRDGGKASAVWRCYCQRNHAKDSSTSAAWTNIQWFRHHRLCSVRTE